MNDAIVRIGYLGEMVEMPSPESLSIEQNEICRTERTASGRMVKDVVAVKKAISLSYPALEIEQFSKIKFFYESGKLVKFEYVESGTPCEIEAYITNLPREIVVYDTDYVSDVKITLEEV